MLKGKKIGFIGIGSAATAIIQGLLKSNTVDKEKIYAMNRRNKKKLEFMKGKWEINTVDSFKELANNVDLIILAVKPADVDEALHNLKNYVNENHRILSIAAGIKTIHIENIISKKISVMRAMPNTSCHVLESATAIALGRWASVEDGEMAKEIFESIGLVRQLDEKHIEAVTGLSGSGPAYIYSMIEAMTDGGQKVGIPKEIAKDLVVQTLFGAAKMVKETGEEPSALRRKIATPGGSTLAGLSALDKMNFREAVMQAVIDATERCNEIGEELERKNNMQIEEQKIAK